MSALQENSKYHTVIQKRFLRFIQFAYVQLAKRVQRFITTVTWPSSRLGGGLYWLIGSYSLASAGWLLVGKIAMVTWFVMTVDCTTGQVQRSSQNASGFVSNNLSAAQPVHFHLAHLGYLQTAVIQLEIVGILEKVAVTCQNREHRQTSAHNSFFPPKSFSFHFLKTLISLSPAVWALR